MSSPQILVVEDEALVAKHIGMELSNMGYSVCGVASCGEEAIRIAAETHPDLVLMDIVLKGDLDGVETTEKIHEHMDVPVVYLTAYADDHMLNRAKKTQPFGYLLKPYEERELHTTIQVALHKHRMERALKEMQEWLDSTLRWMPDAMIVTDARGEITLINPMAEDLTGWSKDQAVGQPWNRVVQLERKSTRGAIDDLGIKARQAAGAVVLGDDCALFTKDGQNKPVEGVVSAVYDRAETFTGWILLLRDITDRLRVDEALRDCEEQLRRWEKMETAGRIAAGMAHDFNHLLTAILGNLSLVLADLPSGDRNRGFLMTAEKAALQAADIIKQLLTFTLRKKKRMEPVNLNEAAGEITDFLCCLVSPRVTVRFDPSDGLWPVCGDRAQLKEVILNLCLNAQDAMPDRGELWVHTENVVREEEEGDTPLLNRRQELVCLRVSDTGHGIPADVQARMFEPFFSTKGSGKGTGMGLALVAAIIENHGGWVDCHSELGQGTRFDVYLPRYQPERNGRDRVNDQ